MQEVINTQNAPSPIGPYSQAIRASGFIFVSGQIPIDPASGAIVAGDIAVQTRQVMKNLSSILEAAGTPRSTWSMESFSESPGRRARPCRWLGSQRSLG